MTLAPVDLASQKDFTADWSSASVDDDLRRWSAFLTEQGIAWSLDPKDRDFVTQVLASAPTRAGEAIELRLSKLANDALAQAGDARRVYKQAGTEPRRWVVLSPEQHAALAAAGQRFESGMAGSLRQLATIPITLGAFFAAEYACRAAGIDANVAWVVALVVYVLTVRVVRGRWPLQRA